MAQSYYVRRSTASRDGFSAAMAEGSVVVTRFVNDRGATFSFEAHDQDVRLALEWAEDPTITAVFTGIAVRGETRETRREV